MQARSYESEFETPVEEKNLELGLKDQAHTNVLESQDVHEKTGIQGKLWSFTERLGNYGVEEEGIEYTPPELRTHTKLIDNMWFWIAANAHISTFATGMLGSSVFYLGFKEAALTIVFFNLLTTLPPAYFSTFGMKLGLRQMALSRFSWGKAVIIPVVLNIIACLGWSVVNTIVGAQCMRAVSTTHQIPYIPAILIIALITNIVSFMGYRVVHLYQKFAWIAPSIILIIMLGVSAKSAGTFAGTGAEEEGSVLSFAGLVAGFSLGWVSIASDYSAKQPPTLQSWKGFMYSYLGMNLPIISIEILGAAMMTTLNTNTTYSDLYLSGGTGGLLAAGLSPTKGFGQFCMVILSLSIVANNIPNQYSLALTFQTIHPRCQSIPRPVLVLVGTVIYIVLACVGYDHFQTVLTNLLSILSYWLGCYTPVVALEHLIFRKGQWKNYQPENYNTFALLPQGFAALFAMCCGVAGFVPGMSQVWFVGPLALKAGKAPYGGDVGFEMALVCSSIGYVFARYFEKKYYGV